MKIIKRKAQRIEDRLIKKKVMDVNIYESEEKALINKAVEIIVKIIKKEIDLL